MQYVHMTTLSDDYEDNGDNEDATDADDPSAFTTGLEGSITSTDILWLVYTQISPAIFIARRATASASSFSLSIHASAAAIF